MANEVRMTDNEEPQDDKNIPQMELQHPLPEEIRKMARDETVCKFCGVSYLIHNEIKALEDKLKATEEEVKRLKGAEAREGELKAKLAEQTTVIEGLNSTIVAKDAVINTMKNELRDKEDNSQRLDEKHKELELKFQESVSNAQVFSTKLKYFRTNLPTILSQLHQYKSSMSDLRQQVENHQMFFKDRHKDIHGAISSISSKQAGDITELKQVIENLQNQTNVSTAKEQQLQAELSAAQSEIKQLQGAVSDADIYNKRCQELQSKANSLESELEITKSQCRTANMESEQYKAQLKAKSVDLEQVTAQLRNKDTAAEQTIAKLKRDLAEKISQTDNLRKQLNTVRNEYEEHKRLGEAMERKASTSHLRSQEMSEALQRARSDYEAMKKEREMMIDAHQNQIEQLRESFKRRIAEADKWPQKMEEAVRKERQKHAQELRIIEEKLKQNFVMELQIEKQKHDELLKKYTEECKNSEGKLQSQLNVVKARHNAEISDLHKQLAENKTASREQENALRSEINSLKRIISKLEARLARLDSGNDEVVSQMRQQMSALQEELKESREENNKLEDKIQQSKEEILFLQDTVRQECEERFELTEALSEAKEELLRLKKPLGGYGATRKSNGNMSSRADSPASQSEDVALLFKKTNITPHPPLQERRNSTPTTLQKELLTSKEYEVPYPGEKPKTGDQSTRSSGSALQDSRKRIAEAIGRK